MLTGILKNMGKYVELIYLLFSKFLGMMHTSAHTLYFMLFSEEFFLFSLRLLKSFNLHCIFILNVSGKGVCGEKLIEITHLLKIRNNDCSVAIKFNKVFHYTYIIKTK